MDSGLTRKPAKLQVGTPNPSGTWPRRKTPHWRSEVPIMANGSYQADSSSDRIKVGEDAPELKGDRSGVVQRHTDQVTSAGVCSPRTHHP